MNRSLPRWQFIGFLFVSLGGVLLHFLYDWTNENPFAALISGVNESTWEHMKLLFFPLFFFALTESRFFRDRQDFWCVKCFGTLLGLLLIPVLFYTGSGMFGPLPDWINISIFFISAAVVFLTETWLLKEQRIPCSAPWFPFALLCLVGAAFIVFTFRTPQIPLFRDPLTGTYGI